jgi:hypothetical protein
MDAIKVSLLLGSVRIGRRSEDVARYLLSRLTADARFLPELLDIASYRFTLLEERPSEMKSPPEGLEYEAAGITQFLFMGWPDLEEMRHFSDGVRPCLGDSQSSPTSERPPAAMLK